MKRVLCPLFLVLTLLCIIPGSANAQVLGCYIGGHSCLYDQGGGILKLIPPIPVNTPSVNSGLWCADWGARNNLCAPPSAADNVCTTCSDAEASSPINLATGNTYVTQTDISIPGLGGGLTLSRTWNSKLPAIQSSFAGMFGMNWRSNYEERLILVSDDGYLKRSMADGAVWSFGTAAVGSSSLTYRTAAPANDATSITTSDTVYTLVAKSGEKKLFDNTTGSLLSIIDRNGNATQLSYDSANRLVTVTDAASRHLYFSYPDSSSHLVNAVTSDVGLSLTYVYDTQGRLILVTNPDNNTISFDYDSQSKITAVRDSDGKILESHTYDAVGRAVSSSRANGVDSVTVTYQQ
jgi:YD repeat-containing protein